MAEHSALVVVTPSAARAQTSGASLRTGDVRAALRRAGYRTTVVERDQAAVVLGDYCLGVAVSFVMAPALGLLRQRTRRTWLDAVDSWRALDLSGIRAGHATYAARALRDAWRSKTAPAVDLCTWISAADRSADRGSFSAPQRLVLPASTQPPTVLPSAERRLVMTGDWAYAPNRDGLRWFERDVLPLVRRPVHVYGSGAGDLRSPLERHGYEVEAELYRSGDIHLAPVRFGGGVKRKVVQPLLAGLPVIATTAAAAGLRPSPLLCVAQDADSFAAAVLRLHSQPVSPRPPTGTAPGDLWDADDREQLHAWLGRCPCA